MAGRGVAMLYCLFEEESGFLRVRNSYLVNFMNINPGHQGSSQGFSPLFNGEASPYLSPLFGTASLRQLSSPDDFTDFRLEEQEILPLELVEPPKEEDQQCQLLFEIEEAEEQIQPLFLVAPPEKQEISTPAYVPKPNSSPIFSIVCFMVENDQLPESDILALGKPLYQNSSSFETIFKVLLGKFKKLRKTKEEMIKFCMRKAFKYSSDCKKSPKGSRSKKGDKVDRNPSMEMPFRKNSSEKTMNSQFLRQVFSSSDFCQDYENFLKTLSDLIQEDNLAKVEYLADTIQKMVAKEDISELEGIKRLPWTKTILRRTEKLARNLIIEFGQHPAETDE